MSKSDRIDVYLIAGGKYHNIDHARLELLKLLAEQPRVKVQLGADYSDIDAICSADFIITYTCDVVPTEGQTARLQAYMQNGGKWFALHGTNSSLRYNREKKRWEAQRRARRFFDMLGSQFMAHPPIQEFTVRKSKPHPLVDGIRPFKADDEIYLCEFFCEYECLVETEYSGMAKGFQKSNWRKNKRVPIMYLHPWEDNEILYLNLGHARGHYDMRPLMDYYDNVERGSWKTPAFRKLIRRGIRWALRELD